MSNRGYFTFIKKGLNRIIPSDFDRESFIGLIPLKTSDHIITKGLKWNLEKNIKWGFLENLSCNNKIMGKWLK